MNEFKELGKIIQESIEEAPTNLADIQAKCGITPEEIKRCEAVIEEKKKRRLEEQKTGKRKKRVFNKPTGSFISPAEHLKYMNSASAKIQGSIAEKVHETNRLDSIMGDFDQSFTNVSMSEPGEFIDIDNLPTPDRKNLKISLGFYPEERLVVGFKDEQTNRFLLDDSNENEDEDEENSERAKILAQYLNIQAICKDTDSENDQELEEIIEPIYPSFKFKPVFHSIPQSLDLSNPRSEVKQSLQDQNRLQKDLPNDDTENEDSSIYLTEENKASIFPVKVFLPEKKKKNQYIEDDSVTLWQFCDVSRENEPLNIDNVNPSPEKSALNYLKTDTNVNYPSSTNRDANDVPIF